MTVFSIIPLFTFENHLNTHQGIKGTTCRVNYRVACTPGFDGEQLQRQGV